jgi:hypothetical protein
LLIVFYKKCEAQKEIKAYSAGKAVPYLTNWYKKMTGFDLDLQNPKTLTEKQQWIKLFGVTKEKTKFTDKYLVRQHIANLFGEKYLIPIISFHGRDHFYNAKNISFEELPNSFVVQCNHGSGMTHVIKDKNIYGKKRWKKLQRLLNRSLKENYAFNNGLELVYKNIKPCIFFTKYLEIGNDLPDYKFMCFNGIPKYVWVDCDRFIQHKRKLYNIDFSPASFVMGRFGSQSISAKPKNYEEMLSMAETLCQGFDYVRVDLYNVNGNIYFGELTFSSGSGIELPNPIEYNEKLGKMLKLGKRLPIV